jgi:hypothetical protein
MHNCGGLVKWFPLAYPNLMKKIKLVTLLILLLPLMQGCSGDKESSPSDRAIYNHLKYKFRNDGFKSFTCSSNVPTIKLQNVQQFSEGDGNRFDVIPKESQLTFYIVIEDKFGVEKNLVGTTRVMSYHNNLVFFGDHHWISFQFFTNEWHIFEPYESISDYCTNSSRFWNWILF